MSTEANHLKRSAAHMSWANTSTDDRATRTASARKAFRNRFITEARERYGDLPESELVIRAESLRKAHYARMAAASARARSARASGKARAA